MKQRILITGATGFLGSNLLERLREDSGLAVFAKKFDLTNSQDVISYIKISKPDIVYHLGALVDLTRSFDIARKTAEANIVGTVNLLEACMKHPVKKFIFASTEEVYGEGRLPYKETDGVNPPSPYAVTKLIGEHLVRLYASRISENSLVLRIGTMYGPHQPERRFIYQIIHKALNNEDIPLTAGTNTRDYIYVDDVVEALVSAKETTYSEPFEIINVGSGHMTSLTQLAEVIVEASGSSSRLRTGVIPDRIGEAKEWLSDITKVKKILGWVPKTDIQTGIKKTIVWIKK